MYMITRFKDYLAKTNLAKNTVTSYVWTVNYFLSHYGEVNKKNLLAYKGYLVENFKPQTVNLRLQGINKYLEFTKHDRLKVKFVKVQQKNFLENVISDADYKFLKAQLKADGYEDWYFVVWFMAATGARVSELLHIKVEHVKVGYLDLYKGAPFIYSQELAERGFAMAEEERRHKRLSLSQPIRATYYDTRYCPTAKAFCR